jgi:chromosome segregation ATPase
MEKEKKEINVKIEKIKNNNNNLYQENQILKSNQNEDELKKEINQLKQILYKNEKEYFDKYKLLKEEYLNLKKQRDSLEKENLNLKQVMEKINSNQISKDKENEFIKINNELKKKYDNALIDLQNLKNKYENEININSNSQKEIGKNKKLLEDEIKRLKNKIEEMKNQIDNKINKNLIDKDKEIDSLNEKINS